jgi:hypothetical protein
MTTVQYLESLRRIKCYFYTEDGFSYAPVDACHNDAQFEIEESNFVADENGTRVAGTYWKPLCWDCMRSMLSNPSAGQVIRKVS